MGAEEVTDEAIEDLRERMRLLQGDLKANIAAFEQAIKAISKGMGLGFVQTAAAHTLLKIVEKRSMTATRAMC